MNCSCHDSVLCIIPGNQSRYFLYKADKCKQFSATSKRKAKQAKQSAQRLHWWWTGYSFIPTISLLLKIFCSIFVCIHHRSTSFYFIHVVLIISITMHRHHPNKYQVYKHILWFCSNLGQKLAFHTSWNAENSSIHWQDCPQEYIPLIFFLSPAVEYKCVSKDE